MTNTFRPWQLLSVIIAGMLNERQQQIIEFLKEENCILRAQIGKRRLRLSDDDRRRLAAKGKVLGRRVPAQIATIVIHYTIQRGHRGLIAAKWTYPDKRVGRPGIMKKIRELIVRMATNNAT